MPETIRGRQFESVLAHYETALQRLHEVAEMEQTGIVRDALIHRFVNAFETAWRAMPRLLALEGVHAAPEAGVVLAAAPASLLSNDEAAWGRALVLRDNSPQAHRVEIADELIAFVRASALPSFDRLLSQFHTHFGAAPGTGPAGARS